MNYNYNNDNVTNEYKVEEAAPQYFFKQQGEYTIEDYYALPEEVRAELIDGVIYDMTAPRVIHQRLLLDIATQLKVQIDAKNGNCQVYVAPVDVRLGYDNKTMVQPDVIILCNTDKEEEWGINGAPDFVLEVLSPSTRRKDMVVKLEKYRNSGVREYWVIDPKKMSLFCFDFENEKESTCSLEGEHGLAIYGEEIRVNLSSLAQNILEKDKGKKRRKVIYSAEGEQRMTGVEEKAWQYLANQRGEHTIEDYFALPDDKWAELIDGCFYEMETPPVLHQEIAMNFLAQVYSQVKERGDKLFSLRTSVQLDQDNRTMMLPDMMIICDKDKQKKWVIYGAPDFILEILSDATRKKDLTIKHRKYLNAGVREYWIMDPKERRLITYDFENGENVESYPLTEKVGLSIYNNEIVVDLTELAEIIEE